MTNIETTYQGDRYELAKMMVQTDTELTDLSTSVGGVEKLAQIIYDPTMDHDESFLGGLVEQIADGKSVATALSQEAASIIDNRQKDLTGQLPLIFNEEAQKLVSETKKELASYSQEEVEAKLQELHSQTQPALAEVKEEITDQQLAKTPEINETLCDTKPLEEAKKHIGTKEGTGAADVFLTPFMGKGASAKKTPWCAGFVSYCLKSTGHEVSKNPVSAKSYANELGKGHIAFWDKEVGKMIAGNYSNKVAYQPLPSTFERNTPERIDQGLFEGLHVTDPSKLPNGAIIIMNRSSSQRNMA